MSASLGKEIDAIALLKRKRDTLTAQVNALEAQISVAEEKLLAKVQKAKLDGATGKFGRAVIDDTEVPTVEDWDKLYAHIAKKKHWDLLQKRVGTMAVRQRWEQGEDVPGVKKFRRITLSVVQIKAKKK